MYSVKKDTEHKCSEEGHIMKKWIFENSRYTMWRFRYKLQIIEQRKGKYYFVLH